MSGLLVIRGPQSGAVRTALFVLVVVLSADCGRSKAPSATDRILGDATCSSCSIHANLIAEFGRDIGVTLDSRIVAGDAGRIAVGPLRDGRSIAIIDEGGGNGRQVKLPADLRDFAAFDLLPADELLVPRSNRTDIVRVNSTG